MIQLKSNITLEVQPGGTILGSPDIDDYPKMLPLKLHDRHGHHLIFAEDARNVTIRGGGTIDGNGPAFWEPRQGPRVWIKAKPRASAR